MTISAPVTSMAKKHSVVSQCVTRTKARWRGVAVSAATAAGALEMQAASLTPGIVPRWRACQRWRQKTRGLATSPGTPLRRVLASIVPINAQAELAGGMASHFCDSRLHFGRHFFKGWHGTAVGGRQKDGRRGYGEGHVRQAKASAYEKLSAIREARVYGLEN